MFRVAQRSFAQWLSLALVVCLVARFAPAAEKDEGTITDPAKGGPDYAVQGEYLGELKEEGSAKKYGAQVVALGDSKFDIVLYQGGLPGEGWKRGDKRTKATSEMKDGATTFDLKGKTAKIVQIVSGKRGPFTFLAVADSGGGSLGELTKVERKSKTLGAKPPEGAVVLFDGKSADKFKNGKIVMGDLLLADCESLQKFGDHTLHVEFRTPFVPKARGQARGNSGVYAQARYEIQVLDSFGLEGENNECGGIYSIAKPEVNMCFPPLTWQTYDIDFTAARYDDAGKKTKNARITIKHNGVTIHDNIELAKGTPGKEPEGPGPGGVYLQGHGNPVVYKNIWVVEKK
jgi:hypothetical protein